MLRRLLLAGGVAMGAFAMAPAVTSAQSISEQVMENYKKLDNGFASMRSTMVEKLSEMRDQLPIRGCTERASEANVLEQAYDLLIARSDSFKIVLAAADEFHYEVPDSLYQAEGRGERLRQDLIAYFQLSEHLCANDSVDPLIRVYWQPLLEPSEMEAWHTRTFFHVPPPACHAVLSKIQLDAAFVQSMVLQDMLVRCDPTKR